MTTGERIAQKRKELGLSQEQLGEQLGVSRQSIYKWESDAALPEVEKLVALSKLFSVTVGWLLGVEDESKGTWDGELTEAQLRMVAEIAARYRSAPDKKRLPLFAAVFAIIFIALLAQMNMQQRAYNALQEQVSSVQSMQYDLQDGQNMLYEQTDGITDDIISALEQKEKIVSSSNVDWNSEDDYSKTITYTANAIPKTYTEDMEAVFIAQCGDKTVEAPAKLGDGKCFSAKITCPYDASGREVVSVAFISDGIRQTEVIYDSYADDEY